jgi:hypothetical protein
MYIEKLATNTRPGFSEIPSQTQVPLVSEAVWLACQQIESSGVSLRRTAETDANTTICVPDVAAVGARLLAVWEKHIFLWTDGQGKAVMLSTNDIARIKPLADEKDVMCNFIPGGVKPTDIFKCPQEATLIHISKSADEATGQEIKKRARVARVINIPVNGTENTHDAWMWNHFAVAYNGSNLNIFPVSGDVYVSFQIGNHTTDEVCPPLYIRYGEYIKNGGVIGWSFMTDAYNLNNEEMHEKYPRNRLHLGGPKEYTAQVAQITHDSKIEFTDLQIQMYVNLRLIPSEHQQVVYAYGPTQPRRNDGEFTTLVHPTNLGEIGLLGQVLRFTQDREREAHLQWYLKNKENR